MANPSVYLAGPVTGLSFKGSEDWRIEVREKLWDFGCIEAYSPLRHKDCGDSEDIQKHMNEKFSDGGLEHTMLSSVRGVFARCRNDVLRADAVLVNVVGATKVSIGTVMELSWANAWQKPIVLIMEKEGNPHEHGMLRECCYFRTPCLQEGILTTYRILAP